MKDLGTTGIEVFELCLGGNVFGWTADRETSFAVLDAYVAAGGNFIDTADVYMSSAPGNSGGESEAIIGEWLEVRGNRDELVIATKVGMLDARLGLGAANVSAALEDSLRRLRTDRVDIYYAHKDDPGTPLEETLEAFDALVRAGKVMHLGASNYEADRLEAALAIARREGWVRFEVFQPRYSLIDRGYESELMPLIEREGLPCTPYHGLARGFLTGKYRPGGPEVDSPRAERVAPYLEDERAMDVLGAVRQAAEERGAGMAAVALAWVAAQPTVVAPLASARNTEQLTEILGFTELELTEEELDRLSQT
jgi:aryl-alcohol dehydrogenase-like predicted oxidoreductase